MSSAATKRYSGGCTSTREICQRRCASVEPGTSLTRLKVAVPTTRSGMIACALFCMMFSWNDFLHPMFLTTLDSKPISVASFMATVKAVVGDA